MNITVAALRELCPKLLTPLINYETVKFRNTRRVVVEWPTNFIIKMNDHGHVYILETIKIYNMYSNTPNTDLPKASKRLVQGMSETNYQKYAWKLKIYNKYMEINRTTVGNQPCHCRTT